MTFDLNKHMHRLLQEEPFFGILSRSMNKIASKAIPTAGVRVEKETGRYEMVYNPEFFEKLTDKERHIVLVHEFYHLMLEHVTERLPEEGMSRMWNVATDAAINSDIFPEKPSDDIKTLFDMAVLPEKLGYPRGKSAEWYFARMKEKQEEQEGDGESGSGEGDGTGEGFDSHEGWDPGGEIPDEIKQLAKHRLQEAMKEAAVEANSRSWGSVSSQMRQEIIARITPKVDWRQLLRYFIKTSQRANKMSSVKKINKRYPYIHSGRKISRTSNIAISIDQSGSVSDNMLAAFYAELNKLADLATFTVIPFDTRVEDDKVFVWKKGENRVHERVLCGGTCFNAPTKWVNERQFDGHIVLTDMYAPQPVPSKCQRMWMTDAEGARQPYFTTNERVVQIDYD